MRSAGVSRTALNVAGTMVTLGARPGWRERLPAGLPELSEALLLAAGQWPFTPRALELSRQPLAVQLAALGERFQPGVFEGLGERKIFMDEQVLAAIDAGATQVLVLGAGFDTLCLRRAPEYPDIGFIEIDHPATSRVKSRAVTQLGRPENMFLLAADLGRQRLAEVLAESGHWQSGAASAVVAEGLLYYLSPESVRALFAELAAATGPGSRVAFSHLFDRRSYPLARLTLALAGEPWLSASTSDALPDYIGPGWDVIETRPGLPGRDLESLAVAQRR